MTSTQTDQLSQARADFQAAADIATAAKAKSSARIRASVVAFRDGTHGIEGRASLKAAADSAHQTYLDAVEVADAVYARVERLRMADAPAGL